MPSQCKVDTDPLAAPLVLLRFALLEHEFFVQELSQKLIIHSPFFTFSVFFFYTRLIPIFSISIKSFFFFYIFINIQD